MAIRTFLEKQLDLLMRFVPVFLRSLKATCEFSGWVWGRDPCMQGTNHFSYHVMIIGSAEVILLSITKQSSENSDEHS